MTLDGFSALLFVRPALKKLKKKRFYPAFRAKSTDRDKLTANQRFCHSDFVTVTSSQSEGLGKMALSIVKYFYDRPSQPIVVIWFAVSLSRSVVVDPCLCHLILRLEVSHKAI